ncbi:MAG: DUF2723 domain-containing protein [Nitrospira sp.]|nr:DUF2723 domain-containing protein [Nitrospira sp.]
MGPASRPVAGPPAVLFRTSDWLAFAASALAPFLLYVLTMPRTVVLEDDGLFLMVGSYFGIAHPPGYPLYTPIVSLFMLLPFGSPAFMGHLSSAFLGALACGCVYGCARVLNVSTVPAVMAAWLFGASEHVWAQSIIAEVYTLNALLFFATYVLVLYGVRQPDCRRVWMAAAVVYGLSLANHWPLMVLAFPGLVVAALPAWQTVRRMLPRLVVVSLSSAVMPYAWMVWRSHQNPMMSFHDALDSWKDVLGYINRRDYTGVDISSSAGWDDRLALLEWFGHEIVWQWTLLGFVLMLIGLQVLCRRGQFAEAGSGVLVFLGNSGVLIALLAFDFEPRNLAIFRPYSLVCYGLAALWLAVGFQLLLECLPVGLPVAARKPWLTTGVAVLAGLGMTAFPVQAHWHVNDRSRSDFAQRYADVVFGLVPQDAVLIVYADTDTASLGYYHFVEERRPDITLLNGQGILYGNRLYPPRLSKRRKKAILREFVRTTDRPVFLTGNTADSDMFTGSRTRHYGFVQELLRGESGAMQLRVVPESTRYFAALMDMSPKDGWERFMRNTLLAQYGGYLGWVVLSGNPGLLQHAESQFVLAERSFYSLMGLADVVMQYGHAAHWTQLAGWLDTAGHLVDEALTKKLRGRFYYMRGYLSAKQGQPEAAVMLFREAYAEYPHPESGAVTALGQLGQSPLP